MGFRIEKNHYGYRNDTQNQGEPSVRAKVSNPILHFAALENQNPSVEEPEETPTPAAEQAPVADSDETPTSTTEQVPEDDSDQTPAATTEQTAEPTEEAEPEPDEPGVQRTFVFKNWETLKQEYQELNQLPTDKERVIEWHKRNAKLNPKSYVIIDKANCQATVYSAEGEVLESFDIGIGKQKGDEIQLENVEIKKEGKKISIDKAKDTNGKTFETTSAGIYYFSGKAKVSAKKGNTYSTTDDYNEYSIKAERGSTGVTINTIPNNHPELFGKMYNKNSTDNRFTDGDVNLLRSDFKKLGKHLKFGTEVFILPEDSNNKIVVRDGQLNLVQQEFTGTVSTSKKPTVAHPIEIDLKPPKPEKLDFLGWVWKWTGQVPRRAVKSVAELYYQDESRKTEYIKALESNSDINPNGKKEELMENLDIDNDTYNDLATLAIGIANQETRLGQSAWYEHKERNQWEVPIGKWIKKNIFRKKVSPYNSRGMSQTKLDGYKASDVKKILDDYLKADIEKLLEEKGIEKGTKEAENEIKKAMAFKKLGITPDNVKSPEKSAIATMVILTSIYKNELPGLKSQMKELNLTWQEAILYIWQGKKQSEIIKGKATPDKNNYIRQAKRFMAERVRLKEVVAAPKIPQ